jgi:hypothetical protein
LLTRFYLIISQRFLPQKLIDHVCADCKQVHLTMRAWSCCNCNWSGKPKSAVITPPKKKNSQNYHGGGQDDDEIEYKVYTSDREKSINVDEEEKKGTLNNRTKRIMRKDSACSKKRKKVASQNKWGLAKKKTNRVKTIKSTDDDDDDNYKPQQTKTPMTRYRHPIQQTTMKWKRKSSILNVRNVCCEKMTTATIAFTLLVLLRISSKKITDLIVVYQENASYVHE